MSNKKLDITEDEFEAIINARIKHYMEKNLHDTHIGNRSILPSKVRKLPTCILTDDNGTYTNAATQGVDFTGGVIETDTDDMADLANDRININTTGIYNVGAYVETVYAATYLAGVYIYKNGAWVDVAQQGGTEGGYMRMTVTATMPLEKGDYIEARMYQNSGTTRTAGERRLWATMLYST